MGPDGFKHPAPVPEILRIWIPLTYASKGPLETNIVDRADIEHEANGTRWVWQKCSGRCK
jgi:hypothetical protein